MVSHTHRKLSTTTTCPEEVVGLFVRCDSVVVSVALGVGRFLDSVNA